MGSGHILVYAFNVLMQIYERYGYTQRDAARSILKNNIFGLDIDKRAYQLAYFSIMMKARYYNRRILTEGIEPNLCYVQNSTSLSESALEKMGICKNITQQLISDFEYAAEYGSVITGSLSEDDLKTISNQVEYIEEHMNEGDLIDVMACNEVISNLVPLLKQAILLTQKYDIVVTNPPYMPVSNAGKKLNDYVKKNYPDSKTDLFAVFIERCQAMLKVNGYQSMITMHSWMFLNSYEKLRVKLLNIDIVNMIHLGARAFDEIAGEVVQTTSFVLCKRNTKMYKGEYCRLLEPKSQLGKEKMFLLGKNRYSIKKEAFSEIPGTPMSYWLSTSFTTNFEKQKINDRYNPKFGMSTGNGDGFIHYWYEVDFKKFDYTSQNCDDAKEKNKSWYAIDKGGTYRKWYGNKNHAVWWKNDGADIKACSKAAVRSPQLFFTPHISWALISSSKFAARFFEKGYALDTASNCLYFYGQPEIYVLGLLNSVVADSYLAVLNPTINFSCGVVGLVPYIEKKCDDVNKIVELCINESRNESIDLL